MPATLAADTLAAVAYTLITVTGGGSVSHSRGYDTLRVCEEAKSLALTGQTLEKYAAEDDAIAAAQQKYKEQFYKTHLWHKPVNDVERERFKQAGSSQSPGFYCGPIDRQWADLCSGVEVRGKEMRYVPSLQGYDNMSVSYSPDRGEWVEYQHNHFVLKYPTDVKVAECVVEPAAPQ